MKFVIVTAVFVTASYAWDLSQFGKQIACATTCAESAADSVGKCQIGKDVVSCLCKNLSGIKSHAAPCAAECGLPDQVQGELGLCSPAQLR